MLLFLAHPVYFGVASEAELMQENHIISGSEINAEIVWYNGRVLAYSGYHTCMLSKRFVDEKKF